MGTVNQEKEKRSRFFAAEGINTNQGPRIVEVRPRGSTSDNAWEILGICKTEPKINSDAKFSDVEVGFESVNMAKIFKGMKPTVDLSLMCLTHEGLKLAYGVDAVTLKEPTTAIAGTVDTTTPPTYLKIMMDTSIPVGMTAGKTVAVRTGGTDNPQWEVRKIKKVDGTAKTIEFYQPLYRKPIDGADVKVILEEIIVVGDFKFADLEMRTVALRKDGSEIILEMPIITNSKLGDEAGGMDAATETNLSVEVLANPELDASENLITTYFKRRVVHAV